MKGVRGAPTGQARGRCAAVAIAPQKAPFPTPRGGYAAEAVGFRGQGERAGGGVTRPYFHGASSTGGEPLARLLRLNSRGRIVLATPDIGGEERAA